MEHRLKIGKQDLQTALGPFLRAYQTTADRIAAVEGALESAAGKIWREQLGQWTVRIVPVELLVPEVYRQWRPLVRHAMLFVVSRLSAARLAPKIVEQLEMPADTPPEKRLLQFIARVPGLQKIGQVLARNRNLDPRFQRALAELENSISDVRIREIRAIIFRRLGAQLKTYAVRVDSQILSEASVSAVVRFTWLNPQTRRRERGVFKVLKPYIPDCYAEDMKILEQLAEQLARRHRASGVRLSGISETLTEIRLLLEREVDFQREQETLANALGPYRTSRGIRVPRLIPELSTEHITALTHERGVKVTQAFARQGAAGARLAGNLARALIAIPTLSSDANVLFHADPHAGNLLYDRRRRELVILDWALTERLSRPQRRYVVMLVLMTMLRDGSGIVSAIEGLRLHRREGDEEVAGLVRERVSRFLDALPALRLPAAMDAMRLLDEIALEGVRFPAVLLMFRKAAFTLEGVLEDIAGSRVRLDSILAQYAAEHWLQTGVTLYSLLGARDWIGLEYSLLTLVSRLVTQALWRPRLWTPGVQAT